MVCCFLPQVRLRLAVDSKDYPLAVMLIDIGHMQALFVDPAALAQRWRDHGHALRSKMTTDVNEQNAQTIGFYERMSVKRTGRFPLNDQGRPYPLIHLEWNI